LLLLLIVFFITHEFSFLFIRYDEKTEKEKERDFSFLFFQKEKEIFTDNQGRLIQNNHILFSPVGSSRREKNE